MRDVHCGGEHTLLLKNDGELMSCGNGENGQLYVTQLISLIFLFKLKFATIRGHGKTASTENFELIMKDTSIVSFCCGSKHSMVYVANGDLLVFGYKIF